MTELMTKRCRYCLKTKVLESFYKVKSTRKGEHYLPACKDCEKAYQRKRYAIRQTKKGAKNDSAQ